MSKTILILIDGCRVDTLMAAQTPHIDRLMETGAWTMEARTVRPSITLPVHFSIFTSTTPATHGVITNGARPPVCPSSMGLFQWVKSMGKTTAVYYNWEYLRELSAPGYLDRAVYINSALEEGGDMKVAGAAATGIVKTTPDFAFVYLGCPDEVGHAHGYESTRYLQSLEKADAAVGHLVMALQKAGLQDRYSILLQSDHGGVGYDHTAEVPEVMTIPWIISGPRIRPGKIKGERKSDKENPVSVLDSAPTLMRCMNLPLPPVWQGRVVAPARGINPNA